MKNMRLPLIISLAVAVIGVILGSFLDLNISSAIADPHNNFALALSTIGPTIGFAAVAAMGGGCALVLVVALARILAAAHYLSDVYMGAAITLLLTFIANEVVIHIKTLQLEIEVAPQA